MPHDLACCGPAVASLLSLLGGLVRLHLICDALDRRLSETGGTRRPPKGPGRRLWSPAWPQPYSGMPS
jgi:hypothetical protein